MNEINNVSDSLEASIAKDNLFDIVGSLGDYSLDKLLDLGEGIPIISYFSKGVKATIAVRDMLFLEKVVEFLRTVGEVPTEQRLKMIDKIQSDKSYNEKFGKASMIALERFNDVKKARILGQAAKYLSRDELTFRLYKRLSFTLDRLYIDDLLFFSSTPVISRLPVYLKSDLETLGLIKSEIVTKKVDPRTSSRGAVQVDAKIKWEITRLGMFFKQIVEDKPLELFGGRKPEFPVGFNEPEE
ncbi:hypothetical protein [Pedobacter cryotolerans]|uniref:DUF4393 domain-containing protein n=1 Tax=Pedobacter cryotolerans TaxID=2571270 RepID=A0A4U1BUR3_9SPHI|nr:hypothetical protein [Pedobacter cryotolerans]TKB96175.1 hypothetical protein FA045_18545 [Pedobacter cryotolerans]